jgi:hypothetical protein
MKPTVYIETTIAGHLTSRLPKDPIVAGQMVATRRWWEDSRPRFELFTSELVMKEAAAGDSESARQRLEILAKLPLLAGSEQAENLAMLLLKRNALPQRAQTDAAHVAVAATNGMDYLLTWNCRHLANAALRTRIEQACKMLGVEAPIICTPTELP